LCWGGRTTSVVSESFSIFAGLISRSGPLSLIIGVSSSRYGTRLVKSVFAQSQQVCLAYCPQCGGKLKEFCPMVERCILAFYLFCGVKYSTLASGS
jgi:hypothetical protein